MSSLLGPVAGLLLLLSSPAHAVTRAEILDRAQAWVDDSVPYSFSAWYDDPTTGDCCYRTDCSGFISAIWGLPAPGHTTYSFAGGPWDDGVSYEIDPDDLKPGDALNFPGDPGQGTGHIMLYVSGDFWSGWVEVYEEYSHGHDATHRWRSIDPSIYLAIRYTGVDDCSPEVCDGKDNDCDGLIDENAADEVCNGQDDDCDGDVDEEDICLIEDEPSLSAWRHDRGTSSDLDGDGTSDVCGRGVAGLYCHLSNGAGFVALPVLTPLANSEGFSDFDQYTTVRMADVNGDGLADVCARDDTAGFNCWPSTGSGFGPVIPGPALTDAMGWTDPSNLSTLRMVDLEHDGMTDVCARSDAGLRCWRSDGTSITDAIAGTMFSDAAGWNKPRYYSTIRMGDVDGDGLEDVCARSKDGIDCWLFDGAAFSTHIDGPALSNTLGWDDPRYYLTIELPDVNGDGRADVCARSATGIYCWPSTGAGFGSHIAGPELSNDLGWGNYNRYSTIRWADVTGDGRDDVCARASNGIYCWPSTGTGFGSHFAGPALSDAQGWLDPTNYQTLAAGDVNGDGMADLCARTNTELECWLSTGTGFSGVMHGPAWSDALGWSNERFYATIRVAGVAEPLPPVRPGPVPATPPRPEPGTLRPGSGPQVMLPAPLRR